MLNVRCVSVQIKRIFGAGALFGALFPSVELATLD